MIRTRFAPSPTGELHIGGARTALFNFLLARGARTHGVNTEGKFILRVDDTDRERSQPRYERQLMEDLRWLGLDWDEGPDMGLPVPYRQSERGAFYDEALRVLREQGQVYPCFCSEKRLETLREEQLGRGEPPRYDGFCRNLDPEVAARRIDAGEAPCWRFALPDREIVFHDVVRGEVSFPSENRGDFVASRSDGQPMYLFASVVDDHLMEITHIIRGDEHVPNTARQQAIFDALGWKAPIYAHIPMILSESRQKLSKRTGSTPISRYREEGYLPEALSAYLATLSWTPHKQLSASTASLISLEEMAPLFSLSDISTSSPIHDEVHLRRQQKEAMRKKGSEAILAQLTELEPRLGAFAVSDLRRLIDDLIEENYTLPLLKEALSFLTEPSWPKDAFFMSERWVSPLKQTIASIDPWTEEELNRVLRAFMKEHTLKGKDFFHPLRLALTGQNNGSALTLVMCVLGRDEIMKRL